MKVLSLLQPWATLLVRGHKLVETRSWPTNYRGPIFIHASGSIRKRYMDSVFTPESQCKLDHFKQLINNPYALPFGKIIGMVEIGAIVRTEELKPHLSEQEIAFGDYSTGRWAWQCCNPIEFSVFTDLKGQLGIRDCPVKTGCPGCDADNAWMPRKDGIHYFEDKFPTAKGTRTGIPCTNMR